MRTEISSLGDIECIEAKVKEYLIRQGYSAPKVIVTNYIRLT